LPPFSGSEARPRSLSGTNFVVANAIAKYALEAIREGKLGYAIVAATKAM
jgi:hypothetical protein